jgi:hypothetical protein
MNKFLVIVWVLFGSAALGQSVTGKVIDAQTDFALLEFKTSWQL